MVGNCLFKNLTRKGDIARAYIGKKSGKGPEMLRDVGLKRSLESRHASGKVDGSHAPNPPPSHLDPASGRDWFLRC